VLTSLDLSFNKLVRLPLLGVSAAAAAAEASKGAKKSGSSNRKKKAGKSGGGKGGDGVPAGFPLLQYLDCSNNELGELGTALPPQLTYLDLSYNKLLELPDAQVCLIS
jgi:Leucine-rich repeat (LRR) protein